MKTIKVAKKRIELFEPFYKKAVQEMWSYNDVIAGVNVRYWLMSQVVQESRANANAVSPVGAIGIAQFMPRTAKWVEKRVKKLYPVLFKDGFNPHNVEQSIVAQVWYMNYLYSKWHAERTDADRLMLAMASYNAGLGSIIKAQKVANGARNWFVIKKSLKMVTGGANSRETKGYVQNILDVALVWV
jgi:soluble lytic murein transglycosylase-like protein